MDARKLEYCLLKNEHRLTPSCSADFKKKKGNIIVKNECAQDIVNLCYTDVTGPEGAINRCLIRNRTKLSKFCQTNIDLKIANWRKTNPCFDETEKYCPTQVRFIEIQECLEKRLGVLTPNCKKVVQNELNKSQANPCYRDLMRHCRPNINPEEQNRCLTVNERELSNSCRQFRVLETDKLKKMVDLCENDRKKFCAEAPMRDGLVLKCLRKNKQNVTLQCRNLL